MISFDSGSSNQMSPELRDLRALAARSRGGDQDVKRGRIGAEFHAARWKCVLLQHECDDIDVRLSGQAARALWRHQLLHAGQKLTNFHVAPEKRETLTDEAWCRVVTTEIFAVTRDACLLVRSPPAFGLRIRVDAIPHCTAARDAILRGE